MRYMILTTGFKRPYSDLPCCLPAVQGPVECLGRPVRGEVTIHLVSPFLTVVVSVVLVRGTVSPDLNLGKAGIPG